MTDAPTEWICSPCAAGVHGNHDAGACSLYGSPGATRRCACEWREETEVAQGPGPTPTCCHTPGGSGVEPDRCHRCLVESGEPEGPELLAVPVAELPAIIDATGSYFTLPGYAVDALMLLLDTEGHHDPLVRSLRKAAVQVLAGLEQVHAEAEARANYVPIEEAFEPAPDPDAAEPERAKRKTSASVELMQEHGVTAAEVREWAAREGRQASSRGSLALELVEAYLEAQVA